MFIERYPNNEATSEFPHSEDKSMFTKDSLVAKIKRVKLCFRRAIDFSSKSNPKPYHRYKTYLVESVYTYLRVMKT